MHYIINYFLERSLFVNLLTILIVIIGGWTIYNTNREAFPDVKYDIVLVSTIWSGASPKDVERLVTKKIEDAIKGVDGIKEYRSYSIESRSGISITIEPDMKDTQVVIDDIRSSVENVDDLPEDAKEPSVKEISTARLPVIEWSLVRSKKKNGNYTMSYKALRKLAKALENRFLEVEGIARISRRGWQDTEIFVDMNPSLMYQYKVGSNDVVRAIERRNVSLPGGEIQLNKKETIVRTVGEFSTAKEVGQTPIRANEIGSLLRVRDIAYVYEDFSESEYIDSTENSQSISLTVIKRNSADIIEVVKKTKAIVKELEKDFLSQGIKVIAVNDFSHYVTRRLSVLFSNGIIGLVLVLIILYLFLGFRTALMVGIGIPISFGIAFVIMSYSGESLNLLSMFGLIIALGIIVDDAIIVSENFSRHKEMGKSTKQAALDGSTEVVAPVVATIVTSMAAFGPMLFMSGIFGKFIFSIPFVVILCLLASLFESFVILPSHLCDVNRHKKTKKSADSTEKESYFFKFRHKFYEPILTFSLNHKTLMIFGLVGLLIFSGFVQVFFNKFKLFPENVDSLYIKLEAETGTSKEEMQRYLEVIGNLVSKIPKSELTSFIGRAGIQAQNELDPSSQRGGHLAMLLVFFQPGVDRIFKTNDVIAWLREQTYWMLKTDKQSKQPQKKKTENTFAKAMGASVKQTLPPYQELKGKLVSLDIASQEGGPPVGKPVSIEILGQDYNILRKISQRYEALSAKIEGVYDIKNDYLLGKEEIRITVNEALAAQVGVSVMDLALAVNTGFEGTVATSIQRIEEEVDIRVRFAKKHRQGWDAIKKVKLTNKVGQLIAIAPLISLKKTRDISSINHFDGKRIITISANIDENLTTSAEVNQKIMKTFKQVQADYPEYTVRLGGEFKDTEESLASLQKSFGVALMIIFMILASLFRSLLQPFAVLAAIPFSLIGVMLAFTLHNEPLGFLSFIGIIGLSGVVINDSIVLIDFANRFKLQRPDLSNKEIAMHASSMRLRPVIMTSLTTVGGLLPTAYGLGGYDPFLKGMALAFAWGLLFSTILILIFVPIFYNIVLNFGDWYKERLTYIFNPLEGVHKKHRKAARK